MPNHELNRGQEALPGGVSISERIDAAPETTQDELLGAIFGPELVARQSVWRAVRYNEIPPPAEWIESPEAGMYVDETQVPLYSPSSGGLGGVETYGEKETTDWLRARLKEIRERNQALRASTIETEPEYGRCDTEFI